MYQVVEALVTLAREAGVEIIFNETVDHIKVDEDQASGVHLSGTGIQSADAVLANADLPYVFQNLIPKNSHSRKLDQMRYSCSVISFFWGIDKVYDTLKPHTLFLIDDYEENFDSITREFDLPDRPSFYIHAPARIDPHMAPPGQDTLIAIVPVGHISDEVQQDWSYIQDQARQKILQRLADIGFHDLEEHIKFELVFTPQSWQKRYNLVKGSTHGLCHNLTQLAFFRPDISHPSIRNLYFTGASTRPGTGMPTAMVSGRLAAQRIIDAFDN